MTKINREEYEVLKGLDDKWKWIARSNMYGTKFEAHTSRPYKMIDSHWSNGDMTLQLLGGEHLFQFIQWEDEEPHNIQELIEEYEENQANKIINRQFEGLFESPFGGSEEIGVKDIKWANEEIKKERNLLNDKRYESGVDELTTGALLGLKKALNILDQLDEPEVLTQEWLVEHSYNVHFLGTPDVETIAIPRDDLEGILVPKQELPVIPKFVADVMEEIKDKGMVLEAVFNTLNRVTSDKESELYKERKDMWVLGNQDLIARAWLDGFTIANEEEEQKYYVEDGKHALLCKWESLDGWKVISTTESTEDDLPIEVLDYGLTEQEIKDYDERYMNFAVKVEEMEE